MKYIDEFRQREDIQVLVKAIHREAKKEASFMEVCGGHTMSIHKFGIHSLLPSHIHLISGPGCPVCVTDIRYIDKAIALASMPDTIITTFGDLIRVPGSYSSLEKERAKGARVKIVYSVLDAVKIAMENPSMKVIFLGIGFETTAPGVAMGILHAYRNKIKNFYVLSAHKVMPPAMEALIEEGIPISGYIAPGHVSTITGTSIYEPLVKKYKVALVISGFEPADLLHSILMLVKQVESGKPSVEIQYKRAVSPQGNPAALKNLEEVFELADDYWRGLGVLKNSGLKIRKKYASHDAESLIQQASLPEPREFKGCICGQVLKGLKTPFDCPLFASVCTPENPVGACMVSSEGACAAFYKYSRD